MQNQGIVIGVIGSGEQAKKEDCDLAYEVGRTIASANYIVLTGGRNCGIMEAALKGAKAAGGKTIGILPGDDTTKMSEYTDIPIITGMGNARNIINILSSRVVVAIGEGPGTISEIALALKAEKPVIVLNSTEEAVTMFSRHSKKPFIKMERFEKKAFMESLNKLIHET